MRYEIAKPTSVERVHHAHGRVALDLDAGVYETSDRGERALIEDVLIPAGVAAVAPKAPKKPAPAREE